MGASGCVRDKVGRRKGASGLAVCQAAAAVLSSAGLGRYAAMSVRTTWYAMPPIRKGLRIRSYASLKRAASDSNTA